MAKRPREEECATCGHFHDYAGGEPCSVCGHTLATAATAAPRSAARPGEPAPRVFVGSYDNAARCDMLRGMGITHVLNTVPTSPELYRNSFSYYTTPTTPPDLGACVAWMRDALASSPSARVLVHDMSGTSRAPAVVAAWMVAEGGVSPADALARVTAARPGVAVGERDAAAVWEFAAAVGRGG